MMNSTLASSQDFTAGEITLAGGFSVMVTEDSPQEKSTPVQTQASARRLVMCERSPNLEPSRPSKKAAAPKTPVKESVASMPAVHSSAAQEVVSNTPISVQPRYGNQHFASRSAKSVLSLRGCATTSQRARSPGYRHKRAKSEDVQQYLSVLCNSPGLSSGASESFSIHDSADLSPSCHSVGSPHADDAELMQTVDMSFDHSAIQSFQSSRSVLRRDVACDVGCSCVIC